MPLSQLARVTVTRGPNTISRENVQRKIVVQANVAGRDLGSTVADIRERGRPRRYSCPPDTTWSTADSSKRRPSRRARSAALSLLSIAAIFLMLYAEFRSARTAALVMANLPLALIGGVAAVLLTGGVVSIASLVGFVTLFGIATRNGILLVAHYRQLAREGAPFREAVVRGSLERLSPILMTALTAGLALIPLALGGGEPGNELQTPMAIVILGGLLSATALNMLVLPALYSLFGQHSPRSPAARMSTRSDLRWCTRCCTQCPTWYLSPRRARCSRPSPRFGALPATLLAHGVTAGDKGYIQEKCPACCSHRSRTSARNTWSPATTICCSWSV